MMKFAWIPLALAMAVPSLASAQTTCAGKSGEIGSFTKTIVSSGMERTYHIDIPATYDRRVGTPLVFNFHGLGGNGTNHAQSTGMVEAASAQGYISVHAEGYENSWNAGACCGAALNEDIDDVQFVRDMLSEISEGYCVEESRVHSTGFSNGGYFSHRLACEASDIIASVAPVAGLIGVECDPERPVPVHQTHGTADPLVWYNAGTDDVGQWAALNGCDAEPSTYYSRANVECIAYSNCDDGADVELCSLRFVGHKWVRSRWYDTTEENLDFFDAHPML